MRCRTRQRQVPRWTAGRRGASRARCRPWIAAVIPVEVTVMSDLPKARSGGGLRVSTPDRPGHNPPMPTNPVSCSINPCSSSPPAPRRPTIGSTRPSAPASSGSPWWSSPPCSSRPPSSSRSSACRSPSWSPWRPWAWPAPRPRRTPSCAWCRWCGSGADGYRVRLVRGTGVAQAAWTEVDEATTSSPAGIPVVVLRLRDGGTTTIPVAAARRGPRGVRPRPAAAPASTARGCARSEPTCGGPGRPDWSSAAGPCSLCWLSGGVA